MLLSFFNKRTLPFQKLRIYINISVPIAEKSVCFKITHTFSIIFEKQPFLGIAKAISIRITHFVFSAVTVFAALNR
ncbi:MAG: hypothetical protein ACOX2F_08520 [bacterium]